MWAKRTGKAPLKVLFIGNSFTARNNLPGLITDLAAARGRSLEHRLISAGGASLRNHWNAGLVVPSRELAARIHARWPIAPRESNYRGEVAERHVYEDGAGEIGFISSVSQPFCGDCTRARLSSDGVLYTCLFATRGTSLRDALRGGASDDALLELIRNVWLQRSDRYSEQRASLRQAEKEQRKIEMFYIGG